MPNNNHLTDLGELNPQGDANPLEILSSWTKEYSDTIHYQTASGHFYLFNHPSDVDSVFKNSDIVRVSFLKMVLGEGLLSSEGDHWRKQRKIAMPYFTCRQSLGYVPLIVDQTKAMMKNWHIKARLGEPVDLAHDMNLLTMNVVLQALYTYELDEETDRALHEAVSILMADLSGLRKMAFVPSLVFSSSRQQTFNTAMRTVEGVVEKILEKREKDSNPPNDFLNGLLKATDKETGKPLDKIAIRDEIITTMISGNETTALVLAWAWSLLNHHSASEEKLYQELDSVLGKRSPQAEDLLKLEWTDFVLKEAMRLYPPVWNVTRKASCDVTVGDVSLSEGDSAIICPYTTHRHPEFWDSPDSFKPERFGPSTYGSRQKLAYIPFGGGRHLCLGMHFALIEASLVMALVGQQFRIRPVKEGIPGMDPGLTLRFAGGYPVHLESR